MTYQDLWAKGKCLSKGDRECEGRYLLIKDFCEKTFKKGFSVCDIGANMNYFGIRLAEDFDCRVMSFEFHQFLMRSAHLSISGVSDNILFINRHLKLKDLNLMYYFCKFDLVLALSVLHHIKEDQILWENELRKIGRYVIIEYAGNDSKRAVEKPTHGFKGEGILLGYGNSHLDKNFMREIIVLKGA